MKNPYWVRGRGEKRAGANETGAAHKEGEKRREEFLRSQKTMFLLIFVEDETGRVREKRKRVWQPAIG